jgi:amino acid adenylation domain-containing protein
VAWNEIREFPTDPPSIGITEQDLCYILYTSGSTGTPKGIMHTHRSALAWAEVSAAAYGLSRSDIISNYAPLHFDLSTLDYFGGARAGATTVIIPEEYPRFPASLADLIASERLTVFYTVPLALVRLAAPGVLDGRDLSDLRLVLFGGEPMPVKHLREFMRKVPHAQYVNVYGPTETNGCVHYVIPGIPEDDVDALPIGRPYPNVDVLIVDDDGSPVGAGGQGELLVRAPTVMRGYWGRPDLNEHAFVLRNEHGGQPDVFEATGDIVARASDGNLRFLGRRDRQIKARGNRVELDEVEAVLLGHPEVHEAAVYAMPDGDGSLQIHAEVILVDGSIEDSPDLLSFLRGTLPAYAVPATLGIRSSFPRTSTGKIDRKAMQMEASTPSSVTVSAGPEGA